MTPSEHRVFIKQLEQIKVDNTLGPFTEEGICNKYFSKYPHVYRHWYAGGNGEPQYSRESRQATIVNKITWCEERFGNDSNRFYVANVELFHHQWFYSSSIYFCFADERDYTLFHLQWM